MRDGDRDRSHDNHTTYDMRLLILVWRGDSFGLRIQPFKATYTKYNEQFGRLFQEIYGQAQRYGQRFSYCRESQEMTGLNLSRESSINVHNKNILMKRQQNSGD